MLSALETAKRAPLLTGLLYNRCQLRCVHADNANTPRGFQTKALRLLTLSRPSTETAQLTPTPGKIKILEWGVEILRRIAKFRTGEYTQCGYTTRQKSWVIASSTDGH